MKIYVVTRDFFSSVERLFHNHQVELLPKDYKGLVCDLVVFSGGEDVHPNHYGVPAAPGGWYNEERDIRELGVMYDIQKRRFSTKKVLGICRGVQLINVALGGSLIKDIRTQYGQSHPQIHELKWLVESPLKDVFPRVNSLHHQGLKGIPSSPSYVKIAVEPQTGVTEIIEWNNPFFGALGVQFHPELMVSSVGDKFVEILENWIDGKVTLSPGRQPEKKVGINNMNEYTFMNSNWPMSTTDADMPEPE